MISGYKMMAKGHVSNGQKLIKIAWSELMFPCNGNFPGLRREKLASMRPLVAGGKEN
jgi:hypothetical protein